jgi:hypothetical protein
MIISKRIAALILIVFFLTGCEHFDKYFEKGNLPGIAVEVPVYPQAQIGPASKSIVEGVPSGTRFRVNSVLLLTDETPEAVLEFYKGTLADIRVTDYGGYYAVMYRPEGFKEQERIEIQIPKDNSENGYEVRQFRLKKWSLL